MLTFNLKKEWFDKIKSGEKAHEYREVKPYWTRRIANIFSDKEKTFEFLNKVSGYPLFPINNGCEFVCGYASKDDKNKRLKARIKSITIINGRNTDLAIDKVVYDIEFELTKEQTDEKWRIEHTALHKYKSNVNIS